MISKFLSFFKFGLFIVFLSTIAIYYVLFKPIKTENPYIIEVEKGEGFNLIINDLYQKNLLSSPLLLKVYCRISGKSRHAQAGEYLLTSSNSSFDLIDNISKGKIYYRKIRFKEGDTFNEVLNDLLKNPNIKIENEDLKLTTIFSKLDITNTSLEGLFHPDTYNFKKGDSYIEILRRSHEKHKQILDEVWKKRSMALPLSNPYEALILGSIIEKEGVEKKEISGVFNRRIKLNMKLQSDPTVIFALGKKIDGNIRSKHLIMRHPYNTYFIRGLPPGPIGLVSKSSLEAAVNPHEGTSLYFVSKGDGFHIFSDTLKDHNNAVKKYQIK